MGFWQMYTPLTCRQIKIYNIFTISKSSFLPLSTHPEPGKQWYAFCHYKLVCLFQNFTLHVLVFSELSQHLFEISFSPISRLFFLLLCSIPLYRWTTICPFTYEHLMCFQFLTIINKPAMNINVQITVWTCIFISFC